MMVMVNLPWLNHWIFRCPMEQSIGETMIMMGIPICWSMDRADSEVRLQLQRYTTTVAMMCLSPLLQDFLELWVLQGGWIMMAMVGWMSSWEELEVHSWRIP